MCWSADFVFPLDKACQPVTPVSCFCILSQVVFIINTLVWVESIFSTNSRQESEYLRNLRIYLRKVQRFLHLILVSSHEVCHITHLFFLSFFNNFYTLKSVDRQYNWAFEGFFYFRLWVFAGTFELFNIACIYLNAGGITSVDKSIIFLVLNDFIFYYKV